ncbi:MAG: KEOPS complex subunit Pcc1 [Halodesulfurarchaeum sp.]
MSDKEAEEATPRRATISTPVEEPELVAASIRVDNTAEMETEVERNGDDGRVITTIQRETTGGLHSTLDDYVVNLQVATTVVQHARANGRTNDTSDHP